MVVSRMLFETRTTEELYQGRDKDAGIHWCKIDVSVSIEILSIFYTIAALFFYRRLPSSRNDRRALLPHCLCSCRGE